MEVLYSTGCRVSELCNLRKDDVDWTSNTVCLFGKGKKYRLSYLNAKAEICLKNYLAERRDNCEYLIVTERGHHQITPSAIQKIFRDISSELCEKVNKPITPHIFRHTTATVAIRSGMPVEDVRLLLGHSNINTTMIYAKADAADVQSNHKKCIV
jgi:integrase/recombinase XerD